MRQMPGIDRVTTLKTAGAGAQPDTTVFAFPRGFRRQRNKPAGHETGRFDVNSYSAGAASSSLT